MTRPEAFKLRRLARGILRMAEDTIARTGGEGNDEYEGSPATGNAMQYEFELATRAMGNALDRCYTLLPLLEKQGGM